ncbi:enoyl-CoA hydratase/isomerase family protein [Glutamicibacter sp. JL.03c]|uniref:enoyl-CoA hydratase/isomerase family protein n=1 Tax=Glutamicibacter sp. JL.03c TaxID=2984842 RepID=UPI0021F6A5BA|nr:enoyl-CoA hydratase/isomerase family protein [Glutamicibacter sp. JL.03c]UYQ77136.1 enoyl-CoA hydratase/isomerase family protein [Glutamicibacter sp. JL.03c]
MAQAGRITVGIENSNATVMLDNPAQYNALTKDMCLQLVGAFATLAADPAVRTIVLRGVGSSFCSGIAIDQMDRVLFDPDEQSALINHFDLVDRSIQACGKATIAVVEGNCYGGGWQLASACDIQLASDQVRLAITPAKIGLLFPRPGIERLVRTVGEHRAKYLLFSGARLPAGDITSWGLFTRVVPQADLETQLAQLLEELHANSQYSIERTKEAIALAVAGEGSDGWWDAVWEENAGNADLAEGRAAFLAHRAPKFSS